jgi:hypothetical protein
VLNQALKRNMDRFPGDFCFQLTRKEWSNLKSQFVISSSQLIKNKVATEPQSGSVAGHHGGRRSLPRAFTEHGAIMAATILNSPEAIAMSVYIVRAFIRMREQIVANAEILKRLAEIDKTLLKHDKSLQIIWSQLQPLLAPPEVPPKRRIGFHPDKK